MTVWEVGHIRRYLKLNQGIKVAPWFSKTGDFKRSRIESKWGPHLSTTWRPRRKSVFWKPGRGPPAEPELLVPCSQTSSRQHYEKINVCCLSHSVYDILLWQPELTNAKAQIINILGLCARTSITRLILECLRRWQLAEKSIMSWIQLCKTQGVPGRVNRKCKVLKVVEEASSLGVGRWRELRKTIGPVYLV